MTPAKRPSTRARQTPIQSLDDLQPDPLNANRGTEVRTSRPNFSAPCGRTKL